MQDLVGFYVFLDAKSDALDVWGQGSESLKPAIADTEKPEPQMRGGGGALQRAFISEYGSEFKTPEGKISFSEANAAYAIEVAKPVSEKLDHIRTKGKRATFACRENFQKFGKPRAGTLSSFGTVKHTELKKEEERRDVHLMLTDMELAQASRPVESSLQIAALRSQQNAVFDLVQDRYPGDIPKQVAMIRRTSRLHACQQKKAEREEDRALTEAISRPVEIQGVDEGHFTLTLLGEEIFDISKTQAETVIEPDDMTDDFRRESIPVIAGGRVRRQPTLPAVVST